MRDNDHLYLRKIQMWQGFAIMLIGISLVAHYLWGH